MKVLKVILLLVVFAVVVCLSWSHMGALSIEKTVLNSEYYKGLISETDAPATIHQQLQARLEANVPSDMPEDERAIITDAFATSFSADWLQEQFVLVIDDVLSWIKGEQEVLTAAIDVRQPKQAFSTALEDAQIPGDKSGDVVLDMPDQLVIADLVSDHVETVVSRVQLVRGLVAWVPYVLLALFLIVCCLLAGISGGLKWSGASMVVSGCTFLLAVLMIRTLLLTILTTFIPVDIPIDTSLLVTVARYTSSQIMLIPGLYGGAGLALIILGTIIGKAARKRSVAEVCSEVGPDQPDVSQAT